MYPRGAEPASTVTVLLIADDTHVLSKPEDVVRAILTIRRLYADIGISLAETTLSKNVAYDLGRQYTPVQYQLAQDAGLYWVQPILGLQVGGTPVGSLAYMVEVINATVDAIIDELYLGPNGTLRARIQTIFAMVRQCSTQQLTYLLRTCYSWRTGTKQIC